MLVILGDLHLNDGTTGATLPPGAFSLFAERLQDLAFAASWRADGVYRPVERIDLVLLGDVLDLLHSARWSTQTEVKPWGNPHSPEFFDQIAKITEDILHRNETSLAILRSLAVEQKVSIPPMLRTARPATAADNQPVLVRTHYMVGNHDWFYHLPGPKYDTLRQMLIEKIGLANRADRPFPHDISESDELLLAMRRHKTTARHGDVFDPLSFEGDRDASSLGDAIVLELVNRFGRQIESELGMELPDAAVLDLREIDSIRPLPMLPIWIDGVLDRACPSAAMRKRARMVWDRLADDFLASDFVRQRRELSSLDLVDGLERTLKFSKRTSTGWFGEVAQWLQKIRGAATESYYSHALTDPDFRNRRAKHVVYGHTHTAEIVPLDASHAEGYVLDQVYFNAGTWRRVYRPARFSPGQREFIAADALSYLAFFHADERKGRPYETWTGTLGHCTAETTIHRIDAGRLYHVPGQPLSTSNVPPHAPHFATLSGKGGRVPLHRRS